MKTMKEIMIDSVKDRMILLDGNRTHVAKSFGVSTKTLQNWLKKWQLNLPDRKIYMANRLRVESLMKSEQDSLLPVGEIKNPAEAGPTTREKTTNVEGKLLPTNTGLTSET